MLRCTIRISSHDLTHHSIIPYHNNHATSPDVATPQTTSLSYYIIPPPSRCFLRVFQRLRLSVIQFLPHLPYLSSIIPKYLRTFLHRDRRNRNGGTQPTTSVRERWSTGRLNCRLRLLGSPKQTRLQPHHHRQHLESLCRLLMSSPDNHECRQWRLDREVLKWGWIRRNLRRTITSYRRCSRRCPIRRREKLGSLFNP